MKRNIKYTPKGYSYVDVNLKECLNWGGLGICAGCDEIKEDLKLIWAIGDVYCDECFDKWLERQKRYELSGVEQDLKLQKEHDARFYECYSKYFIGDE